MIGQIDLFDTPLESTFGCGSCICKNCLMWWSARCPYGGCYDNHRAAVNPYDKANPGKPPRTGWSDWRTDQAFWCRGGIFRPAVWCGHYVEYSGSSAVKSCLGQNVQIFQDGYILCGIIDSVGCAECYRRFIETEGE